MSFSVVSCHPLTIAQKVRKYKTMRAKTSMNMNTFVLARERLRLFTVVEKNSLYRIVWSDPTPGATCKIIYFQQKLSERPTERAFFRCLTGNYPDQPKKNHSRPDSKTDKPSCFPSHAQIHCSVTPFWTTYEQHCGVYCDTECPYRGGDIARVD